MPKAKKAEVKTEVKKESIPVFEVQCLQHQLQIHPQGGGKHICVVCNKEF